MTVKDILNIADPTVVVVASAAEKNRQKILAFYDETFNNEAHPNFPEEILNREVQQIAAWDVYNTHFIMLAITLSFDVMEVLSNHPLAHEKIQKVR